MDFSTKLILSVFFGSVGFGYIVYGRKQRAPVPLIVGVALCVYPYFVNNIWASILIGLVLVAAPWYFRQ